MDQWKNADEILDFAIKNEEEAAELYTGLAARAEKPWMKTIFEGFAKEEQKHKAKLEGVKKKHQLKLAEKQIIDLKIGDYLIDVEPSPDLDYQDALIVAMKAEKAA
ncbi:MAG: rubrerythrin, partial [Deltaproteobacteria bacterium]|nr:rubrerythrin [Deltaproteobacteria bacterium]